MDTLTAVVVSLIVTSWKVYDLSQWTKADAVFLLALGSSLALTSIVAYSKLLKIRAAGKEKRSIAKIEGDLRKIEQSRNWLVATSQLIDMLVTEKYKRVTALLTKDKIDPKEYVAALASNTQVILVVQTIHEFFYKELETNSALRLGVYFRSESNRDALELGYSWDGEKEKCFSDKSADYLRIVRSKNVMSELAKCYNSDEGIIINSDCRASEITGDFKYLYPEQRDKIRSLVVYRFNVADASADEPWIIYLDTNQPGFFTAAKKNDYQLFFERFAKRLSFELVTLELANKVS